MESELPRYQEIRRHIRRQIEEGRYQPGTFIPSLIELAEEHSVNRLTVMKALEPLTGEGLLRPVPGRGFCVVGDRVARELDRLQGFSRTMREIKAEPSVKILSRGVREAGPYYAGVFGIPETEDLYEIKRLCYSAKRPFSLEEILFPKDLIPDETVLQLSVFSLYDLFAFYGVNLARSQQTLTQTQLPASDARLLQIEEDKSVLLFESTTEDERGRVVEFTRTVTRGDLASFTVHFAR